MSQEPVYKLKPLELFGCLAAASLAGVGAATLYFTQKEKKNNNKDECYSIGDQQKRYQLAKSTNNDRVLNIDKYFNGVSSQLKNKRVLVIGASRGLGYNIVNELVKCGADTICTIRSKACDELASMIDNKNINNLTVIEGIDVTKIETIENDLVNNLQKLNKGGASIDILIYNAGYFYGPVETITDKSRALNFEEELKMIDICGIGPLRVINTLINNKLMVDSSVNSNSNNNNDNDNNNNNNNIINSHFNTGGKIVIITSQAGSITWREEQNPNGDNYGHHASRAVTNMIGKLASFELKNQNGIAVGLFHPGFNRTEMTSKYKEIWDKEGAVDASIGAKRVLYETIKLNISNTGRFINCEDGLQIPW